MTFCELESINSLICMLYAIYTNNINYGDLIMYYIILDVSQNGEKVWSTLEAMRISNFNILPLYIMRLIYSNIDIFAHCSFDNCPDVYLSCLIWTYYNSSYIVLLTLLSLHSQTFIFNEK